MPRINIKPKKLSAEEQYQRYKEKRLNCIFLCKQIMLKEISEDDEKNQVDKKDRSNPDQPQVKTPKVTINI